MYIVYKDEQNTTRLIDTIAETIGTWGSNDQESYDIDPKDNKLYYSRCCLTDDPAKEEMAEELSNESKTCLGNVIVTFEKLEDLILWAILHADQFNAAHTPTQQEREDFFNGK